MSGLIQRQARKASKSNCFYFNSTPSAFSANDLKSIPFLLAQFQKSLSPLKDFIVNIMQKNDTGFSKVRAGMPEALKGAGGQTFCGGHFTTSHIL